MLGSPLKKTLVLLFQLPVDAKKKRAGLLVSRLCSGSPSSYENAVLAGCDKVKFLHGHAVCTRRAEILSPSGKAEATLIPVLNSEPMGSPFNFWSIQPCCLGFGCYLLYAAAYINAEAYEIRNPVCIHPLCLVGSHGCGSSLNRSIQLLHHGLH